jgi:hypothetical protein
MKVLSILVLNHKNFKSFSILVLLGPGYSPVKNARNVPQRTPNISTRTLKYSNKTPRVDNSSNMERALF